MFWETCFGRIFKGGIIWEEFFVYIEIGLFVKICLNEEEGRKNETGEGKKGFGDIEGDWGCVDINGHPSTADSSSIQSSGVILGETQVRKKK